MISGIRIGSLMVGGDRRAAAEEVGIGRTMEGGDGGDVGDLAACLAEIVTFVRSQTATIGSRVIR